MTLHIFLICACAVEGDYGDKGVIFCSLATRESFDNFLYRTASPVANLEQQAAV
jgi:hypothetical protein